MQMSDKDARPNVVNGSMTALGGREGGKEGGGATLRVLEAAKREPKAHLASTGTPSQKE